MKIIRDGKEYELTPEELYNAYLEQESIYDHSNIKDNMEGYLNYDEYKRLKNNETFIECAVAKLRKNQDEYDMGYDDALSSAFKEAAKEFRLPVNRVTLIRERWSERETWSDDFWVDASQTPSKELFQKAVEAFLFTEDGQTAVHQTYNDFNWGDAIVYIPDEIWTQFGIYPFDYNLTPEDRGLSPTSSAYLTRIQVDQDEVLIPFDYLDRLDTLNEKKPILKDQIQSASNRVTEPKLSPNMKAIAPEPEF